MSCKGEWLSAVMMQPHQVAGLQKLQRLPPAPPAAAPRATIGAILLSLSAAPHTEVCRLPREEGIDRGDRAEARLFFGIGLLLLGHRLFL